MEPTKQLTSMEERINSDVIEALFDSYMQLIRAERLRVLPPAIDEIHDAFKKEFYTQMLNFLHVNNELGEAAHLGDLDALLLSHGIPIPTEMQLHDALHYFDISYLSRQGRMVNGAVTHIW